MLTMEPCPAAPMAGMAARHIRAAAVRSTARMRSQSSSATRVTGPSRTSVVTALLTRIVRHPKRETAAETSRSGVPASARSAATNSASPEAAATADPRSWSRPVTTTLAPSAPNRRAISAPMPAVDPVTIATSPSSRGPAMGSGAEDVGQLGRDDHLELVVRAGRRVSVGAPPLEVGGVAETFALHVLVGNLTHQLGAQRLPRHVLALAPAAQPPRHGAARRGDGLGPPRPGVS